MKKYENQAFSFGRFSIIPWTLHCRRQIKRKYWNWVLKMNSCSGTTTYYHNKRTGTAIWRFRWSRRIGKKTSRYVYVIINNYLSSHTTQMWRNSQSKTQKYCSDPDVIFFIWRNLFLWSHNNTLVTLDVWINEYVGQHNTIMMNNYMTPSAIIITPTPVPLPTE